MWTGERTGYQANLGRTLIVQLTSCVTFVDPCLTSPGFYFIHHLQNGYNNTDLTGLLWDEMKRCA